MKLLEKIVSSKDISEEIVDVPQWEAKIGVRGMTAKQRADFAIMMQKGEHVKAQVRAVISCTFDPEIPDKPLFEPAHSDMLEKKAAKAVEILINAIIRLSGFGDEAQAEIEKN